MSEDRRFPFFANDPCDPHTGIIQAYENKHGELLIVDGENELRVRIPKVRDFIKWMETIAEIQNRDDQR